MNLKQKSCNQRSMVVVVAVKASKGGEISRTALVWALTHLVQPGECVRLLVIIPSNGSSKRRWSFPRLKSDCAVSQGTILDQTDDITDACTEMMIQLQDVYDPENIQVKIKVVSESQCGVVAADAKNAQAHWVVLDKQMQKEAKLCMEQLECNIVVMKKSRPKVLRLNLLGSSELQGEVLSGSEESTNSLKGNYDMWDVIRVPNVTPESSPEHESFTTTDVGASSLSSLDLLASPLLIHEINWDLNKVKYIWTGGFNNHVESNSDTDSAKLSSSTTNSNCWVREVLSSASETPKSKKVSHRLNSKPLNFTIKALQGKLCEPDRESEYGDSKDGVDLDLSRNMRDIICLNTSAPHDPPPLCSVCRHKAPVFGKPPKWFTYAELERATDGFSPANFLAEGGYGSVHRGVLPDGRVIAVKQHKLASTQGDNEFCSEVEVLSCAQHRNVVQLNGFCVEDKRRLLVYEFICNGSLDVHLYGRNQGPLDWSARQKIAVGAARGLRYLHEECRVGCIVHRDMRPNNILLTHDFEPLVGDFGLARWQPDGDVGVDTRIIGTFGYMAPEYAQSGQITEKADVYAFGVVLVELLTGRKLVDLDRPKGQQFLTEWARPLLEQNAISELLDPHLRDCYSEEEVSNMIHCASLCLRRDPHSRPRMSQVLRMLEGDNFMS